MAINNDLKTIETKLNTLKTNLDGYLTNKGATAGANLTESVNAVDTIQTGGGGGTVKLVDGTKFGYSDFAEVPSNYDFSDINDYTRMFSNCITLINCSLDINKTINMNHMFDTCENLKTIFFSNMIKVTGIDYCFYNCKKITEIPLLDISNVITMYKTFYGCENLISIPVLNSNNNTDLYRAFYYCPMLKEIKQLNVIQVQKYDKTFHACTNLAFINILNLGAKSEATNIDFSPTIWGDDTKVAGSKQSLIDSLLTNSFDRTAAGYSPCTLKLSDTTKGYLTEEEKTAIAAKGFTIA